MLAELFLPPVFGSRRILSQRILGICVEEHCVRATLAYATSSKNKIEKIIKVPLDKTTTVEAALKQIKAAAKNFDYVRVSVPASIAVFKELSLPFCDNNKIAMTVKYEVEPLLPFSIDNASIDFLVTHIDENKNTSRVLVVAARNIDLEHFLEPFILAGIAPDNVTVDLLSLYGLYRENIGKQVETVALVDAGNKTTRIAILQNGVIRLVRNVQKGADTLARFVAEDTKGDFDEIKAHIASYGITMNDKTPYEKSLKKHLLSLLHDIQFTLNSFSLKLNLRGNVSKLLLNGPLCHIDGFVSACSEYMQLPCERLAAKNFLRADSAYTRGIKGRVDLDQHIASTGTAFVHLPHANFDLRGNIARKIDFPRVRRYLLTALGVFCAAAVALSSQGLMQISKLKTRLHALERNSTKKIRMALPGVMQGKKSLTFKRLVQKLEEAVEEKKASWNAFGPRTLHPLEIMTELTSLVDKRLFDVQINEVRITPDDDGTPSATVDGIFKSKTDAHFTDFAVIERHLGESKKLIISGAIESSPTDDSSGVKFSARFKFKGTA
ncbi:pilus assembly protein PilM [bacterium]|jgi:Tfp pilus assembly PilM family ATPase|nr:pilus assembly protein PilM [bacterium]